MHTLAGSIVVAFGLFLIGFGVACVAAPERAVRFLSAFAQTARAHYAEQAVRLMVGVALVGYSSSTTQPEAVRLFGWIVVGTTLVLLCVPWRWHRRFAEAVVPPVLRHVTLLGVGALAAGALLLYAVTAGMRGGA